MNKPHRGRGGGGRMGSSSLVVANNSRRECAVLNIPASSAAITTCSARAMIPGIQHASRATSHPLHAILSSTPVVMERRWPRIGNAFQVKVVSYSREGREEVDTSSNDWNQTTSNDNSPSVDANENTPIAPAAACSLYRSERPAPDKMTSKGELLNRHKDNASKSEIVHNNITKKPCWEETRQVVCNNIPWIRARARLSSVPSSGTDSVIPVTHRCGGTDTPWETWLPSIHPLNQSHRRNASYRPSSKTNCSAISQQQNVYMEDDRTYTNRLLQWQLSRDRQQQQQWLLEHEAMASLAASSSMTTRRRKRRLLVSSTKTLFVTELAAGSSDAQQQATASMASSQATMAAVFAVPPLPEPKRMKINNKITCSLQVAKPVDIDGDKASTANAPTDKVFLDPIQHQIRQHHALSVSWSAGRGRSVQRQRHQYRLRQSTNDSMDDDNSSIQSDWRQALWEAIPIWGDYRSLSSDCETFQVKDRSIHDIGIQHDPSVDYTTVWKAVFEVAKWLEKQLSAGDGSTSHSIQSKELGSLPSADVQQIVLDQLNDFLLYASRLPLVPQAVLINNSDDDYHTGNIDLNKNDNNNDHLLLMEEIDWYMSRLLRRLEIPRRLLAKLYDRWYEPGVDLEVLQRQIEATERELMMPVTAAIATVNNSIAPNISTCAARIVLNLDEFKRQIQEVVEWQQRLEMILGDDNSSAASSQVTALDTTESPPSPSSTTTTPVTAMTKQDMERNDLLLLQNLALEASNHGFYSKGLMDLETRLDKALNLLHRVREWKSNPSRETVKSIAAMVRDVHRVVRLQFPEATEVVAFNRSVEAWIDRASIAIRSRISLNEIRNLVQRGQSMPVQLPEYLDKLKARIALAEDWLANCHAVIPADQDPLRWMGKVREKLLTASETTSHVAKLQELSTQASRIPVEMDRAKLLQAELDARAWSFKARKWIPTPCHVLPAVSYPTILSQDVTNRRGKLEELREHIEKAQALRDKMILSQEQKSLWELDGERELKEIVRSADDWFHRYSAYLDGDNRRTDGRGCLSLHQLRLIVDEANGIYVNLGNASIKMSKILLQANQWFETYSSLLDRCQIALKGGPGVQLHELKQAVDAAAADISMDLDEALEIRSLVDRVEEWLSTANFIAGAKRGRRGKKLAVSVEELSNLIDKAASLPVQTEKISSSLKEQLQSVREWQTRATSELQNIITCFHALREAIDETHGPPASYERVRARMQDILDPQTQEDRDSTPAVSTDTEEEEPEEKSSEEGSHCETVFTADSDLAQPGFGGGCSNTIHAVIRSFCRGAQTLPIVTPEREIAAELEKVIRWLLRSIKYVDSPREIFDKRYFGAFDRFLLEGRNMYDLVHDDSLVNRELRLAWGPLLNDQLTRLNILLADRDGFVAWCANAESILNCDDRKPTIEKLKDLCDQGSHFPRSCEIVQKVNSFTAVASQWISKARQALTTNEKLSFVQAKSILDEGEKLGFNCDEMKNYRNALKAARTWAHRVKRCKLDDGSTHMEAVKRLLDEYSSLLVTMPDEVSKLRQATKDYCICRRPYDGFMIGCDECNEWFHGPCIGISEAKADRVVKYVCIRCCLLQTYKSSAMTVLGVIKKWTSEKELKKVRQAEAQKHQRKVKKESKDREKYLIEQSEVRAANEPIKVITTPSKEVQEQGSVSVRPDPASNVGYLAFVENVAQSDDVRAVSEASSGSDLSSENCPLKTARNQSNTLESDALKLCDSISQCEARLESLRHIASERKKELCLEDASSARLRYWCIRVRSLVMVPSSVELADRSRPKEDGTVSADMQALGDEAERLGIGAFNDVKTVVNSFKSMAWCIRAVSILARQPYVADVQSLLVQAGSISLPDEKGLRMLKSVMQRVMRWEAGVHKSLAPIPGEAKPLDITALKDLARTGDDIPLCMPLEQRLLTVIEDKGARHCLCGGPSDGRFMVSCDKCELWYHGHCVGVSKELSNSLSEWTCQRCLGITVDTSMLDLDNFGDKYDVSTEPEDSNYECDNESSHAPRIECPWPPFGLLGSAAAREVLGDECSEVPDIVIDQWQAPLSSLLPYVLVAPDKGPNNR